MMCFLIYNEACNAEKAKRVYAESCPERRVIDASTFVVIPQYVLYTGSVFLWFC